ncbi:hypothetical protein [Mycobacterium sp.]|uniref:channel accessory protein ArfB n=1 Tax=Mycobacterium sp. TaxID=1785 RepID=UPI002D10A6D5|nr:hypothetical protein [Mycobacterium sp.]HTY32768.1 hypothetical protein [Mycobacterium sp.]
MDFVIQWLWYLLAFVAGSAVARVIANVTNKRVGVEDVPASSTGPGIGEER